MVSMSSWFLFTLPVGVFLFTLWCVFIHTTCWCVFIHTTFFLKSFYNNIFIHTSCCVLFTLPFFFLKKKIMMIYLFTLPVGMCAFSHTLCWYVCVFIYSSDCTLHIAVCCALQCVLFVGSYLFVMLFFAGVASVTCRHCSRS